MNRKQRLKIIGTNLLLFAFLFGLVSLNKGFFRPTLNHLPFFRILTGCFPNFAVAYTISFAFVNAILIRKLKYGRIMTALCFMIGIRRICCNQRFDRLLYG